MSSNTSRVLCDNCGRIPFENSHLLPNPAQTSQLRDMLRAYTLPPETSGFRNVIAESPHELARYDSEIQRLQQRLYQLRSDQATLQSMQMDAGVSFPQSDDSPPSCWSKSSIPEITPTQEVDRLAKKYLLQLSQVCSLWYGVVMGTTRLWSTIVVDTTIWSKVPASPGTMIDLVVRSLERSGTHPLVVECAVSKRASSAVAVLELLAQHSRQWQNVYFWNNLPSFELIAAAAKGNLPLLEDLAIHNQNEQGTGTSIFAVAPRLTQVAFTGRAAQMPTLPWEQIHSFSYQNLRSNDLVDSFPRIPLSLHARCELVLDISSVSLPINLPPISNVSKLFLLFTVGPDQQQTTEILGAVLASLTLPDLRELILRGKANRLFWNQQHFLSLASRSTLQASLTKLEIQAIIQDEELLLCISALPSLESFIIRDYDGGAGTDNHALITDNLLRGLEWRADKALVPSLASISLTSLLRFRDDSFWQFITSRIASRSEEAKPFHIQIYWLPHRERECSLEFITRLTELEERGDLLLEIGPDPDSLPPTFQ
ncbi:hypothetical protein C8R44DRAFT_899329 [Mycena epipterygia]|nr:hypothetical protein C8R44DRAFT_899329 [Mycena epipterygia]